SADKQDAPPSVGIVCDTRHEKSSFQKKPPPHVARNVRKAACRCLESKIVSVRLRGLWGFKHQLPAQVAHRFDYGYLVHFDNRTFGRIADLLTAIPPLEVTLGGLSL